MSSRSIPALLISAPSSGQGKTTLVAALARRHRRLGRRVRVFKCGPDYLDPQMLERASGAPVYQLDLFMGDEAHCRQLLHTAAAEADLILIEGVMGLHDGTPSSADLALRFNLPVLTLISAAAMAQTFGAIVHGLASYRPGLHLTGVMANHCNTASHADLLRASLPTGIAWYGALPRDERLALPERHLGLTQPGELDAADLDARLDRAADLLDAACEQLPPAVTFNAPDATDATNNTPTSHPLAGCRIAVARDAAFSFIYPANLDTLRALGAELVFFSPLSAPALPVCDALWLPGGYPELHAERLAANRPLLTAIQQHHAAGKPLLAECGGMLYLAEHLTDAAGQTTRLAGLLPAQAQMQPRLAGLGLQEIDLPEGRLRGHAFHYSQLECTLPALARASKPDGRPGEALYRLGQLTASYMHFYFPSNPTAVARLFAPLQTDLS
jgi:cobyrinic acid a,c-diamide synthase